MEQKVSLVTDYNAGMALNDIMEKYAISRGTLYKVLKTLAKKAEEDVKLEQNL